RRGTHLSMPRIAAVKALDAVERRDAFSNLAIDSQLQNRNLSGPDLGLATALFYGCLKRTTLLDALLERFLKKGIKHLPSLAKQILRVAAYQIVFMDKIPPHAAVSEAVNSAKKLARHQAGLTNAVLRRLATDEAAKSWARSEVETPEALALHYGLPVDLAWEIVDRLGFDNALAYARAIDAPFPMTLRLRKDLTSTEWEPGRWAPNAAVVRAPGQAVADALGSGAAVVQAESSQILGHYCDLGSLPGGRVLDMCAGHGGKGFHLADLAAIELTISDISPEKIAAARANAAKLGISIAHSLTADELNEFKGRFDLIVLDAPCSGAGNLGRYPELRWKQEPARVNDLVSLQRRLIERAVSLLEPGGILVYAVCSDRPSEGTEQAAWALSEFSLVRRPPRWELSPDLLNEHGSLLTEPHHHGISGFFAVRLEKLRSEAS
ncbi:MAG: methyltransferase domain-containing protein, partial [Myxococcales bacterium]|nr:methyltransferase domain-containing protein [Myxococcales bacterium]